MQPTALPEREIRILHRQIGERRRPAGQNRGIERCDLPHRNARGPAVAGDVMHGQGDGMVPLSEAQDQSAQQRSPREIERPAGLEAHQEKGLGLTP